MDPNKKYYTFTFARYESERLERQQSLYFKNLKFKVKLWGGFAALLFIVSSYHPIMMWF
jgi:hypothetical protein